MPSETLTTPLGESTFLSMLTFRRFRFVASVCLSPYIPALRYAVSLATAMLIPTYETAIQRPQAKFYEETCKLRVCIERSKISSSFRVRNKVKHYKNEVRASPNPENK